MGYPSHVTSHGMPHKKPEQTYVMPGKSISSLVFGDPMRVAYDSDARATHLSGATPAPPAVHNMRNPSAPSRD